MVCQRSNADSHVLDHRTQLLVAALCFCVVLILSLLCLRLCCELLLHGLQRSHRSEERGGGCRWRRGRGERRGENVGTKLTGARPVDGDGCGATMVRGKRGRIDVVDSIVDHGGCEAGRDDEARGGGNRTERAETNVKDCAESRLVNEGTSGNGVHA